MTSGSKHVLQVLITTGLEDLDHAALGLNAALVAASSGAEVIVFFTLRGTVWACGRPDGADVASDVHKLVEQLDALGATLECCSKCLDTHCLGDEDADTSELLRPSIRLSGLASVTYRALDGMPSLTF